MIKLSTNSNNKINCKFIVISACSTRTKLKPHSRIPSAPINTPSNQPTSSRTKHEDVAVVEWSRDADRDGVEEEFE